MSLSCSCDYDDYEPGQIICYHGQDFEPLQTSKRKRCQSCKELINIGDFSVKFDIFKSPEYDIEVSIYGEDGEIPMAPRYLCEKCGEIYHNLFSVGFTCIWPGDDMRELLRDYQTEYAPPKLNLKQNLEG